MKYVQYGNAGCGVFKRGGTKLESFLPKNQHTQRKLLNFENWKFSKIRVLEINYFHSPMHLTKGQ